jgi:hypothetical protein
MNFPMLLRSLPASFLLLRWAAWLVPVPERAEWLAEWKAELWHIWHFHSCQSRNCFRGNREVTNFCLGSFSDAFWLRWRNPHSMYRRVFRIGSASRCSIGLALWTAISVLLCLSLPEARKAMRPQPYHAADGLIMISSGGYAGAQDPSIRFEDYESWRTSTRHLFTGLAFYQPIRRRVHVARHRGAELSIGRASDNLFQLLNLPLPANASPRSNDAYSAKLFLSQKAWSEYFGSDAHVAGSVIDLAGLRVLIAGVLSKDSPPLPGQLDAWLLEDERHLKMLPLKSEGFVLAHLRTAASRQRTDEWQRLTVPREDGISDRFDCISLAQQARLPFSIFLFTLIVAMIALPATTALPLGEYPRHSGRLPWVVSTRRWIFFWSKLALVVPLVFFTSIDAAYGTHAPGSTAGQYIQLATSFFGFLFAFRWVLQDQRKRCPVCLRVLSNPARVGLASRNFLAWNGTELICSGGHGLLHIPELPTSWFGTQRWLYLDPSWGSLFKDACMPSAGIV